MTTLNKSDENSRLHDRFPVLLDVQYGTPDGFIQATTANISQGGMFIETSAPLVAGQRAFFTLQLPSNNPMKFHLEAEVIWASRRRRPGSTLKRGMGVRFLASRAQSDKTLQSIFSVIHTVKS